MTTELATAEAGQELAAQFARNLGFTGRDFSAGFIRQMSREHRTLQQAFTRLCMDWLAHLASLPEGHYDRRNQASVTLAKTIRSSVPREYFHLPFI